MSLATLTSKGQITIPKMVRETLHLQAGDKIEFITNDKNEVVLKPVTMKVADVYGQLSKYKKKSPVSIEEMDAAITRQLNNDFS